MKDNEKNGVGRRTLITNMGVATVAGIAVASAPATTQANEQPPQYSKDKWMEALPGDHRVFIDSSTVAGGGSAVRYANNIIVSHIDEYEGKAQDYAMVVCFRHASTPYGYGNAMWEKYGEQINRDPSVLAPASNPMYTANDYSGSNTIPKLLDMGVHFAICKRATRRAAMNIAKATGMPVEEAFAMLVDGAIPNAHFVAAGVLAATRSQEYGYTLLYAE
jgi:intracellular sulfur oxidation DsrE/DsrF family protein